MKMKKKSTAVIICAAMLVAGVSAVFATSPKPVEAKNLEDLPAAVMTDQTVKPAPAPAPMEHDVPQNTPSVQDTSVAPQNAPAAPDTSTVKQDVPQNTPSIPDTSAVPQTAPVSPEQDAEPVQQPDDTSAEPVADTTHEETYEDADAVFNRLCEKWLINGEYQKTADGKTYGPSALYKVVGKEPDLTLVQGNNGKEGFVMTEDRYPFSHCKTPEERVEYYNTHSHLSGDRTVPVYDLEGNVIDTFTFHTGDVEFG